MYNNMQYNPAYIDDKIILSSNEIEKFRKQNLDLNLEISTACSLPAENRLVIHDGVFDYEGYLKSKIKILWIMKEPYDTSGGGWHISSIYTKGIFGAARTTWYPIINVSHSILNGFQSYEKVEKISKSKKTTSQVLAHIAYINVQKLPSKTREKTNNSIINTAFKDPVKNGFFQRQFKLLNPDVIIGANTLGIMFEHFELKGSLLKSKPTNNSYIVNGKLFINALHPANRGKRETYLNNIVDAAREWYLQKDEA